MLALQKALTKGTILVLPTAVQPSLLGCIHGLTAQPTAGDWESQQAAAWSWSAQGQHWHSSSHKHTS